VRFSIPYFILGALFVYLALLQSRQANTVWDPLTLILIFMATVDFAIGIHYVRKGSGKQKNNGE